MGHYVIYVHKRTLASNGLDAKEEFNIREHLAHLVSSFNVCSNHQHSNKSFCV